MKPTVLVVGSTNTDMIANVPHIPTPGETVLGDHLQILPGGKGANQAVAASRLGINVNFISALGDDSFGKESLANLKNENINTDYIVVKENISSGSALIFVDNKGENCIAVIPGANGLLSPEDIYANKKAFQESSIVIIQLEIPQDAVLAAAKTAKENGCKVILNPAPIPEHFDLTQFCGYVDILTPNEGELLRLAGNAKSIDEAAKTILSMGIKTLVVTLGSKGVIAFTDDGGKLEIPAIKVSPKDTVGAGDCFNGALAAALAEGKDLEDALNFAVAAAGISTQKQGAQCGMPTRKEIDSHLMR